MQTDRLAYITVYESKVMIIVAFRPPFGRVIFVSVSLCLFYSDQCQSKPGMVTTRLFPVSTYHIFQRLLGYDLEVKLK
jgi:beta-lactamase class D